MEPRRIARGCLAVSALAVLVLAVLSVVAVKALRTPRILLGHTAGVVAIAFSPGGERLASASGDGTARVWDLETGRAVRVLTHPDWVQGVSFSSDGTHLATACDDRKARLWSVEAGAVERTFEGHAGKVLDVSVSHRGDLLASASDDGHVRIWSCSDGRLVRELGVDDTGHVPSWEVVVFSPDDRCVAAGERGSTALWSLADGRVVHRTDGGSGLAFAPDGDAYAVQSVGGEVRVFSVRTGVPIRSFAPVNPRYGRVSGVAYSAGGRFLAIGHERGVRVFSAGDGALLGSFAAGNAVVDVAFSPDEELCALADEKGSITVWRTRALLLGRFGLPGAR